MYNKKHQEGGFIVLKNQCRQNKKQSRRLQLKTYESRYNLECRQLNRHIFNLAVRFGYIDYIPKGHRRRQQLNQTYILRLSQQGQRQFYEFQHKMVRYHKGNKVHKKLGRMDKVKAKQGFEFTPKKSQLSENVQHLQNVANKILLKIGFTGIMRNRGLTRNIQVREQMV